MKWLTDWYHSIIDLDDSCEWNLDTTDYRDLIMKSHLSNLAKLMRDRKVMPLLTKAYKKIHEAHGEHKARQSVRQFLFDACWLCGIQLKPRRAEWQVKKPSKTVQIEELVDLNTSVLRLARQITRLSPGLGSAGSVDYLVDRLDAGNPLGFIHKRNQFGVKWPAQPTLVDLLNCFASDVMEEAATIPVSANSNRQKGGAQSALHFAMDSLTNASLVLSASTPPKPNFPLVNSIIECLIKPAKQVSTATASKRYASAQKRKTQA